MILSKTVSIDLDMRARLVGALDGGRPDEGLRRDYFAWLLPMMRAEVLRWGGVDWFWAAVRRGVFKFE